MLPEFGNVAELLNYFNKYSTSRLYRFISIAMALLLKYKPLILTELCHKMVKLGTIYAPYC